MDEMLLGFEARLDWSEFTRKPEFRNLDYLASPQRISTTELVWPSVFHSGGLGVSAYRHERPLPPKWIGSIPGLWENLEELVSSLSNSRVSCKYHMISVTTYIKQGEEKAYYFSHPAYKDYQASPSERAPEWRLMGYDVGDRYLDTFLEELFRDVSFFSQWSTHLNKYSLFSTLDAALSYRDFALEHYQCDYSAEVYGIFEIDSPNTD